MANNPRTPPAAPFTTAAPGTAAPRGPGYTVVNRPGAVAPVPASPAPWGFGYGRPVPVTIPMTRPVAAGPGGRSGSLLQPGEVRRPQFGFRQSQTVVLLRDDSGSMAESAGAGTKASEATAASADLVRSLCDPANRDAFDVAIVDFGVDAQEVQPLDRATAMRGVPALGASGRATNITAAIERALAIVGAAPPWRAQGFRAARPAVVLFTDGCHNHGPAPEAAADALKIQADVVTVAFGTDADESLLVRLASTPAHFYRAASGAELRMLLAQVGRTLSVSMRSNASAGQLLSRIR